MPARNYPIFCCLSTEDNPSINGRRIEETVTQERELAYR